MLEKVAILRFPRALIVWDNKRCVHCGACVGQCPAGAFEVVADSREISFEAERCVACKLCVPACSYGALELVTDHIGRAGEFI